MTSATANGVRIHTPLVAKTIAVDEVNTLAPRSFDQVTEWTRGGLVFDTGFPKACAIILLKVGLPDENRMSPKKTTEWGVILHGSVDYHRMFQRDS